MAHRYVSDAKLDDTVVAVGGAGATAAEVELTIEESLGLSDQPLLRSVFTRLLTVSEKITGKSKRGRSM